MKYILITSARNEQAFIGRTLDSVISQTVLPERWVIIDDGSADRTAEIVGRYVKRFSWITLIHRPKREGRNFAAKADAVNAALAQLKDVEFEILGNLDADVSFGPDYMEFLLQKLSANPRLGVAGTPFTQEGNYDSTRDSFEGENYVAGPCQLFRCQCFRDVGGYVESRAGGVDWIPADRYREATVCCVAALGTTSPTTHGAPIAMAATRSTPSPSLAFGV
jgi:glycosyltransferase involved in cell wall biosynthesis